MNDTQKTEQCHACNGEGMIYGILEYNPFDIRLCTKCNGTGYIVKPGEKLSDHEKLRESIKHDPFDVF